MSVLFLMDHNGTVLAPSVARVLAAAKALGPVTAVVCGKDVAGVAKAAAALPVAKVVAVEADFLAHPSAEDLEESLAPLVAGHGYVMAAGSSYGRGALARLASRLKAPMLSDIVGVDGPTAFVRPMYAGAVNAKVTVSGSPVVLTVRPTAFAPVEGSGTAAVETVAGVASPVKTRVTSRELTQSNRPELGSAKVVVSGGRGVGSKENFVLVENLADGLGAAVGASRAAVDAGFAPNDWQVGQTGKVVAPELYVAVGISGAVQHLAGIKGAKTIVAINRDANAPIFKVADYGLVGDLFTVVPAWLEKLKK